MIDEVPRPPAAEGAFDDWWDEYGADTFRAMDDGSLTTRETARSVWLAALAQAARPTPPIAAAWVAFLDWRDGSCPHDPPHTFRAADEWPWCAFLTALEIPRPASAPITAAERAALEHIRQERAHFPDHELLTVYGPHLDLVLGLARRATEGPLPSADERAALDRLETEAMFAWGDPADDPLLADIAVLLALARRASAAATPPIPSGSPYCSSCGGKGWIPAPCTVCAAATPREGGADALYADWQTAVRETEAAKAAMPPPSTERYVPMSESFAAYDESRVREGEAYYALRAAALRDDATPPDPAGVEG